MSFTHQDLLNHYSLRAPEGGGTVKMNLNTPNFEEQGITVKNYYINKDENNGPVEYFSVYSNGLAVYSKQSVDEINIFTNGDFNLLDNGDFELIDNSWQ